MGEIVEELVNAVKARINMVKDFATSPVGVFETIDNRIRVLRSALYKARVAAKEKVKGR